MPITGPGMYGFSPQEGVTTVADTPDGYVSTTAPRQRQGQYVGYNDKGEAMPAVPYTINGVMPYDNTGALLPQYVGIYPGQVGVPDPKHVPVYAGGTFAGYTEPPAQTIAPTTEEALNYGAEIGRLSSAIDTLKANIASGKGDIAAETRKLISYSQRLAALANKAKGTPNPALAAPTADPNAPAPEQPNMNPNGAPAGPPAAPPAPLATDLLVGNPASVPPDYQKASDKNIQYAENMQNAAGKTKDKAEKDKYLKRAAGYSAKAQDYSSRITQKPSVPNA
jgi:hypothetical protein